MKILLLTLKTVVVLSLPTAGFGNSSNDLDNVLKNLAFELSLLAIDDKEELRMGNELAVLNEKIISYCRAEISKIKSGESDFYDPLPQSSCGKLDKFVVMGKKSNKELKRRISASKRIVQETIRTIKAVALSPQSKHPLIVEFYNYRMIYKEMVSQYRTHTKNLKTLAALHRRFLRLEGRP